VIPEEILAMLRERGASEDEVAAVISAATEAAEREARPDPERDAAASVVLEPVRLAINLAARTDRGFVLRDRAPLGVVLDNPRTGRRILLSVARQADDEVWLHGSISRRDRATPTYADLVTLHRAMGQRLAYQLFVPPEEHYSLSPEFTRGEAGDVLHLWAPLTGPRPTPDFRSRAGTI
jgi:hypothetical protein